MNDIENKVTDEQVEALDGTESDMTFEAAEEPVVAKDVYYGSDAIAKVSENLGRPLTFSEQRVVEEEGYVATPYTDTKGIITQGVGQTGEWIDKGFEAAFQHHVERARSRVTSFDSLPESLQAELVQGEYRGDLGGSPNFLRLLNAGEYDLAADEFLNNKDYRDSLGSGTGVHKRMKRLSDAVREQGSGIVGTEVATEEEEEPVKPEAVSDAVREQGSGIVGTEVATEEEEPIKPEAVSGIVGTEVATEEEPVKPEAVSGAASKSPLDIGDSEYKLVDGDTMINKRTGERVRFGGFDAPETTKITRKGGFQRGDQGGEEFTDAVAMVIKKGGFNNPVISSEEDAYGRKMGDLMNAEGILLSDTLISSGIATPGFIGKSDYQMSEEQYDLYMEGITDRELRDPKTPKSDLELAGDMVRRAETAEHSGQFVPKAIALDEAHYAGLEDFYSGVRIRNKNATLGNEAKIPLSQSFGVGLTSVQNAFGQVGSMALDVAGFDDARDAWQGRIDFRKKTITELPKVLMDYKDVDWTSLPEIGEYLGNTMVMSAPFMGVSAAAFLAAPFVFGGSLAVGTVAAGGGVVAMHAGMILDEMEGDIQDKNYGVALFGGALSAVLERVGLKGVVSPASLLDGTAKKQVAQKILEVQPNTAGFRKLVETLGDQAGDAMRTGKLTEAQADLAITRLTKRGLVEYAKDVDGLIAKQITKTNLLKAAAKNFVSSAAVEGSTEMGQELTAYTAAVLGSSKTWDWTEIEDRLANAGIAGGLMGGTLSVPGSVWEAGSWKDANVAMQDYDKRFDNEATSWKAEENDKYGRVRDLDEVMEAEHKDANANTGRTRPRPSTSGGESVDMSFESQADRAQERKEAKGGLNWVGDFAKDPMSALRTSLDTRLTVDLLGKSKTARAIYDMFGGRKNQVHGGVDFHSDKVASYTLFENSISEINATLDRFDTKSTMYGKKRTEVSNVIYDFHKSVIKPLTSRTNNNAEHMTGEQVIAAIDWDNIPVRFRGDAKALKTTISELYAVDNVMYNNITARQSLAGEERIGKLQDHVFRSKSFEKEYIRANKDEFIRLLMRHKKLSLDDATSVTETIIDNPNATDLDGAFDLTKGGLSPAGHKKRSLDISDSEAFNAFLSNNIFDNLENGMKSASRYMGSLKFIGKNNKLLGNMLNKVHAELVANGDPDADRIVEDLAMNLRDLINADSGNYKRIESDMAKGIQKNLTLFGVVTMLPLSAPMSLVEFGLAPMNVPMKALNENIGSLGIILGKEIGAYIQDMGKTIAAPFGTDVKSNLDTVIEARKSRIGQDPRQIGIEDPKGLLGRVGMSNQKTGQATLVGVSDTGDSNQNQIMDTFFKVIGLSGVTNATRTVRASFFNDFLTDNLDKIHANEGKAATNESMEARQMLEEFGMPVDLMLGLSKKIKANPNDEEVIAQWARQFDNGLYNFINAAVPMPSAMTRPLAYSDPHFAMFMQFQGFTSQFTANHLPRIWKTVAKGTPGMKYSTFAALMSMLTLGYAAQYIKDMVKFGEGSPYLSDDKKYLRALYSSGLLGTPERLISQVFPLYEGRDKGIVMNMWETGSGEAPAFGLLKNTYKLGQGLADDDGSKASKSALALTPLSPLKHRLTNLWTGD